MVGRGAAAVGRAVVDVVVTIQPSPLLYALLFRRTISSMGTPTPSSRLSGSKSGGGSTGSRYGAWRDEERVKDGGEGEFSTKFDVF